MWCLHPQTAMLCWASRKTMRWCGSFRLIDLSPRKMKGSESVSTHRFVTKHAVRPTVAHNHRRPPPDGLFGDGDRQVIGKQDDGGDRAGAALDIFLEQAHVVPSSISELLGVAGVVLALAVCNVDFRFFFASGSPLQCPHCLNDLLGEARTPERGLHCEVPDEGCWSDYAGC